MSLTRIFENRSGLATICPALVFLWLGSGAYAETRHVPGEFPTLNAAIDLSSAGDTVLVAAGNYPDYETRSVNGFLNSACVFMRDGVILLSESGPEATSIDPGGVGSYPLYLILGLDLVSGDTIIDGFTLTGAPFQSNAVQLVTSKRVVIRNCIVKDLDGGTLSGAGGIYGYLADLEIVSCTFKNCRAAAYSAGAIGQLSAKLEVVDSIFEDCSNCAIWCAWGNTGFPPGFATITNSVFKNCSASYHGGAIQIDGYTDPVISHCRFEGNRAGLSGETGFGGGVHLGPFGNARVENCIFIDNSVVGFASGGSIALHGAGIIKGNTFFKSSQIGTTYRGSAVSFFPTFFGAILENNVIVESSGAEAVGVYNGGIYNGTLTSNCNVFWNNPQGEVSGHTLSQTDLIVDPLFCNSELFDLTVNAASPCLPPNSGGCGSIGALGQGCGIISLEKTTWGQIKAKFRE